MTQWKRRYIVLVMVYLASVTTFFSIQHTSFSTDQLTSLTIAAIALLISLIQMAESNKRKRPVKCLVKLWGKKKGKHHQLTLKFINEDITPLDEFTFKLKTPEELFADTSQNKATFQHHSYGKTDVIRCDEIGFLGAQDPNTDNESLEITLDLSKPISSNRVFSIVVSCHNMAPVRQTLTHKQITMLIEGKHSSEDKALVFS